MERVSANAAVVIKNLGVRYRTRYGYVHAVTNVSLQVRQNEVYGLVGESGCGKSTLGLCIPRILPVPPAELESGSVEWESHPILELSNDEVTGIRGTGIFMIFQSPLSSLNPVYKVGMQIAEAIGVSEERKRLGPSTNARHIDLANPINYGIQPKPGFPTASEVARKRRGLVRDRSKTDERVMHILEEVRISDPSRVSNSYPHELSGGMRQRIMIAMALALEPKFLIADEPTSALDVTTQAQVLRLLKNLVKSHGTSVLFISHDLGVIANVADRVGVMYAGSLVEEASLAELFEKPLHPYTRGLLNCFPRGNKQDTNLSPIPGDVPDLSTLRSECSFSPRCPYSVPKCMTVRPELVDVETNRRVACLRVQDGEKFG